MVACAVTSCKRRSETSNLTKDGVSYHIFPKDPILRKQWVIFCRRSYGWVPKRTSVICSDHFDSSSYHLQFKSINRKKLNAIAKPTILKKKRTLQFIPKQFTTKDNERIQSVSSPIQFSVEVEEEKCSTNNGILDLSSDDNDILELQKRSLQFIPKQFTTKDNERIQSVSSPIQFSVEVEEEKCSTNNGILDLSSDDNDILELQKRTLQFIPKQFTPKDNERIQSVSSPIRFTVEVEEEKCSTNNGIPDQSSDDNDILELQKRTLQFIPKQFTPKDNERIKSVSSPIRFSGEVEEDKCSTNNGIPDLSSDDNDILELQKRTLQFIPKQITTKDNVRIHSVSSPIRFSVEVEEEEKCGTNNGIQNGTHSSVQEVHGKQVRDVCRKKSEKLSREINEYYIRKRIHEEKRKKNNYTTIKQCTITIEAIMKSIEEQSKENTEENDMHLDIICKNLHGQFRNIALSFYDEEVNNILKVWQKWYKMSPWFRSTPLMYKCYECRKGWWRLHPFKEHLKVHSDPQLKLGSECITDEFSIIAFNTEHLNVKDVEMDSYCWKCGRDSTFHKLTYLKPAKYECVGCNKYMATCTILKQHESTCAAYIKLYFKKYNIEADKGVMCPLCVVCCVNKRDLNTHMIDNHSVRSDEPVILESKVCPVCSCRYFFHAFHDCPARVKRYKCKNCGRTFSSQTFLDIHMEYSRGNSASQCIVPNNYLKNSKNYCLMYMCCKCDTHVLLKNETIYGTHGVMHNNRYPSRLILLPTKCLSGKFIKSESTFQIPDEHLISFLAGIVPLKDLKIIHIGTKTIFQSEKIQCSTQILTPSNMATGLLGGDVINLDDDDDVINLDKDDDVINLDKDDDVINIDKDDDVINLDDDDDANPSIESVLNSENDGDEDCDIKDMQAQLDEEIMRDLEVEATISKVFEASKSYRLLMEKESLEKISENRSLENASKTRQLMEKAKECIKRELISKESIKKLIQIEEDGEKCEEDLIISEEGAEDVNTNNSDIKNEIDSEGKDVNVVVSCNSSDSKQNLNWDTSSIIEEDSLMYDDTITVEPEVFIQQKVKLEPSEDLTNKLCKDKAQIAFNEHITQDMDDVNMEPGVLLHECDECDYRGEWSRYIEHVCMECRSTDFSCNLCIELIRYRNLNHYLQHLSEHDYLPFSCPECQVQHKSQDELHTHVTSHIQVLFSGTKSIKLQDVTLFYCNKCGLGVQSKNFLKHWQMCLNGTNADFSREDNSPECSSVSMSPKYIKEAMKILQAKPKRYKVTKCIVCLRKFKSFDQCKQHLIEHLLLQAKRNQKENKNEMLKCFFCDREFKMVKELEFHTREHSHMRVYRCEICLKCCTTSSNLSKHRKLHNLHAYNCNLCGKKYVTESCLNQHMKLHEKSVPCKLCDMTFVSESKLKKHMLENHLDTSLLSM